MISSDRFYSLFSGLLLSTVLAAHAETPSISSTTQPDRDFRLFIGMNVEVSKDDQHSMVEGYIRNRVRTDGFPDLIALRNVDGMRFTYAPKLSRNPLKINGVTTKKIASTARAARDAMRNQQSLQDFQTHQAFIMQRELNQFVADATSDGPADDELLQAQIAQKQDEIADFDRAADRITDPQVWSDNVQKKEGSLESGAPSALLITAEISAPTRITDAYLVGVVRYRTEESVGNDILFFDRIPVLDPKPRKIEIIKEGLPGEFEVLDVQVHIYRNGQELVTDRSPKQFALTRDEALEYLALARVGAHPAENLPPEPAWALAPAELFASNQPEKFDYPLTVKIDSTGQVIAIDETTIAPESVKSVVEDMFFLPALEEGVPVAGVAHINLQDFFH